jgi:hypothetical protein
MARDFMSTKEAMQIVYAKDYYREEKLELEEELLNAGDFVLPVEKSQSIEQEKWEWDE